MPASPFLRTVPLGLEKALKGTYLSRGEKQRCVEEVMLGPEPSACFWSPETCWGSPPATEDMPPRQTYTLLPSACPTLGLEAGRAPAFRQLLMWV